MAQIIFVEDENTPLGPLQLNLKTYTNSVVIPRYSADDAIALLDLLPDIEVVVSIDFIGEEKTAEILLDYFRKNKTSAALLIFGKAPSHEKNEILNIEDKTKWEQVVSTVGKLLSININALDQSIRPEYIPIASRYFLLIDNTPCDVYIRIKKDADNFQFIKRFHSADNFDKKTIISYEQQGLRNFYISKDMEKYFTNFISNHLVAQLAILHQKENEKLALLGESYHVAIKEITRLGLTTATIQLTEAIITTMIETIEKTPKINNFLVKIVNSPSGFLYQHAHMCCTIALSCAKEASLHKEDKSIFQKIAFASFFQNISLVEHEDLAKIYDEQDFEHKQLTSKEKEKILHHALESQQFIQEYKDIPYGTDILIKHHHGHPDGIGLTHNISQLPNLSRIFALSTRFIHIMLFYKEKNIYQPILSILKKQYPDVSALSTLKLLEKVLQKRV